MIFQIILNTAHNSHKVGLYAFVFASKLSVFLVYFLFLSFFIQPFHVALANEDVLEGVPPPPPVANDVKEQVIEKSLEKAPEAQPVPEETQSTAVDKEEAVAPTVTEQQPVTDDNSTVTSNSTDADMPESQAVTPVSSSTNTSSSATKSSTTKASSTQNSNSAPGASQPVNTTSSSTPTSTSTPSVNTPQVTTGSNTSTSTQTSTSSTTSTSSVPNAPTNTTGGDSGASTQDDTNTSDNTGGSNSSSDSTGSDNSSNTDPEDAASDSEEKERENSKEVLEPEDLTDKEPLPDNVVNAKYLVTEENYYQFSRQSCSAVGDGTFHCSLNTDQKIDPQAVVYADRDDGGDMEIFMRTSKGKVEQLSDNDLDDTAPHFDAESMKVAWQRLVNGRYQVIVYDLVERKESQLTFSRTNNMEPKLSVDGVVWQAWDGNDWEIMYFDGEFTDQLTDNSAQDVTPVIADGYILWSILGGAEREARVYSLDSGEVMTITGQDGGAIANPRFVLVYDTKFDNGDVITQGFDPTTGLSAPIASKPATEPIDIPETDTTGEIRALIQNKSTGKQEIVESASSTDPNNDLDLAATSTFSAPGTMDLKSATSSFEDTHTETTSPDDVTPFELTEYDLVITPTATSSSKIPVIEVEVERASSTQS